MIYHIFCRLSEFNPSQDVLVAAIIAVKRVSLIVKIVKMKTTMSSLLFIALSILYGH
jgi:hypothetical protein